MSIESRILGTIIGGALGDSIGTFTEYCTRAQALELYGPNPRFTLQVPPPPHLTGPKLDQHEYASPPSEWTDDTDQSLLILLSFLASGGKEIDAYDFARRIKFWVENGLRCLERPAHGIGNTVGGVVRDESFEKDPHGTATKFWEGTNRRVASNGAAMRTGIIGALLFQDSDGTNGVNRAMHAAVQVGATTHADPRCLAMRNELITLQDFDSFVQRAIDFIQSPPLQLESGAYTPIPLTNHQIEELRRYIYAKSLKDLELDSKQGNGYTYTTLGAGTWALRQALDASPQERDTLFERCITEITMQGGDADTNAAVAGSLLGAYMSNDRIPAEWIMHLKGVDWLVQKTRGVAFFVAPEERHPVYEWRMDEDLLIDGGKGPLGVGDRTNSPRKVMSH
ncbi:hypothetical protein FRC07_006389 [Ceratobasidium sp. 392]|nr:hypothetical protein FRC07_006389 [Ceratobasidium sp. 392]